MNYRFDKKIHLHLLDEKPLTGTSSIEDVLSKPLTWWASGKAVETFGWLYPKIKKDGKVVGEVSLEERLKVSEPLRLAIGKDTPEEYLKRLDEAYKAHSVKLKDSAKSGVNLHEELERFVKGEMGIMPKGTYDPKIQPFIDWAEKTVKQFLYSESHCFDQELWVGGISDAGAEMNDGTLALLDFKSAKEAYTAHFIQAAGYAIQIEKNGLWDSQGKVNKKLDKPFDSLIVIPFGAEVIEPAIRHNVADYKEGFRNCVSLYRLLGLSKIN